MPTRRIARQAGPDLGEAQPRCNSIPPRSNRAAIQVWCDPIRVEIAALCVRAREPESSVSGRFETGGLGFKSGAPGFGFFAQGQAEIR